MAWLVIENGKEILIEFNPNRTDGIHYDFILLKKGEIKRRTGVLNPKEAILFQDATFIKCPTTCKHLQFFSVKNLDDHIAYLENKLADLKNLKTWKNK